MAFLTSTRELPSGGFQREIPDDKVWSTATGLLGLHERDYGSWWFVYESREDYENSLD